MLLQKDETYDIIGAAIEVHRVLRCGFTEPIYQDALEIEFQKRNIPFEREKHLNVIYKDIMLRHNYFADVVSKIFENFRELSKVFESSREYSISARGDLAAEGAAHGGGIK